MDRVVLDVEACAPDLGLAFVFGADQKTLVVSVEYSESKDSDSKTQKEMRDGSWSVIPSLFVIGDPARVEGNVESFLIRNHRYLFGRQAECWCYRSRYNRGFSE